MITFTNPVWLYSRSKHPPQNYSIPPICNGWEMWYGKNGLFYYKTIQDCRSYDLQNLGLKIHNFSLELKQSKTPPAVPYWGNPMTYRILD